MLVDYLMEVVDGFELSQESLFLAVQLLDAFAAREHVPCTHLQLLGATCLWVAAKYEEVAPPSLQVCGHTIRARMRLAAANFW